MHSQEWSELVDCCDCHAPVAPKTDRVFALDADVFLCFGCAIRRGGIYDEDQERWVVTPDVADVPDERRAHP